MHKIILVISNPVDRELLTEFIGEMGHNPVVLSQKNMEDVIDFSMIIADENSASVVGDKILSLKSDNPFFLPALVAISKNEKSEHWLKMGFDDVLRIPLTKAELSARINTFLQLREYSEQLAKRGEERFRKMAERITNGLMIIEDGRVVFVNQRLCEITGYSKEELAKLTEYDIAIPEEKEKLRKVIDRKHSVFPEELEFRIIRKDGESVYIQNRYTVLKDSGKTIVYVITTDITERKLMEEQLRRYREHLQELVESRTKELQEVIEELRAFTYSVSHDLRAPLRAMQGFAQALIEEFSDKLNSKGIKYVNRIIGAADRMDELIRDLLEYSYISRKEIKLRPVKLEKAIEEAIKQLEEEIKESNAKIKVLKPLPDVMAHPTILTHVIMNLISNAIKFADKVPDVSIGGERKGDRVTLWVKDNGIGIPEKYQEKIFRIFERLHGIEKYPGTGIGLAIVKKAIEKMGGRVGVESSPGAGSRFWIELQSG